MNKHARDVRTFIASLMLADVHDTGLHMGLCRLTALYPFWGGGHAYFISRISWHSYLAGVIARLIVCRRPSQSDLAFVLFNSSLHIFPIFTLLHTLVTYVMSNGINSFVPLKSGSMLKAAISQIKGLKSTRVC